jgi:imidazolonepropionase
MVDLGIPVAIATDFNPGSSPISRMPIAVGLGCLSYGFSPAESLTAGTINAAWAVGQGLQTGSLEQGKMADILVLRVTSYMEVPYWFGLNPTETVVKAGKLVI